jgi:hypothetical protein
MKFSSLFLKATMEERLCFGFTQADKHMIHIFHMNIRDLTLKRRNKISRLGDTRILTMCF